MKINLRIVLACAGRGTWEAQKTIDVAFTPSMDIDFELPGLESRKPKRIGYDDLDGVLSVGLGIVEFDSHEERTSTANALAEYIWTISGR